MTSSMTGAPSVAGIGPGRGRWVRAAALSGVALAAVVVLVLLAILQRPEPDVVRTDPTSARPAGSKAVVEVLRERGVGVAVVTTLEELRDARLDADTTLVVTASDAAPPASEVADLVRPVGRLVLVQPDNTLLSDLSLTAERVGRTPLLTESTCGGDLEVGWRVEGGAMLYRSTPSSPSGANPAMTCLLPPTSPLEVPGDSDEWSDVAPNTGRRGAYLLVPGTRHAVVTPETVLLGTDAVLVNESVTRADHAAFALRVLGRHPRLVWYLPTPTAVAVPPDALAPPWFGPGVLALAGAAVGLVLWRGRRLGRLSVEPLPVVVPATEITHARGRLYQRAGEPGRALDVLRRATAGRLAASLGIVADPGEPTAGDLIGAVARATGRAPEEVAASLEPPPTRSVDEARLVREARLLEQLEREVRGR